MKIESWKITDVKPYHQNPRINDAAVGLFGGQPNATTDKSASETVRARQRAKVIESLDTAPRMNAGNLRSVYLAANGRESRRQSGDDRADVGDA